MKRTVAKYLAYAVMAVVILVGLYALTAVLTGVTHGHGHGGGGTGTAPEMTNITGHKPGNGK